MLSFNLSTYNFQHPRSFIIIVCIATENPDRRDKGKGVYVIPEMQNCLAILKKAA